MAGGMEAKHDLAGRWFFDPQPLRADGHPAVGADLEGRAHAPDIIPPGAARCWTQCGALFLAGLIPSALRSLAQFTMDFVRVAVGSQGIDGRIGHLDFPNLFTGEVGWYPPLPELLFGLDFAFGLGRGGG